jgi:ornithine cyclodeaminase/alanine dehydrogenase-like protein (mu-crystallin family)
MSVPVVSAAMLRECVGFRDLIEPTARVFREYSARQAEASFIAMFPAERPELGDVYVKTGSIRGHAIFIVKISPWFAANAETGNAQGGFIAVFDSATGHTLAILAEEHYLSDIRTAAAGALAARTLAPTVVRTVGVVGTGVQAFWQPQALFAERPFETLLIWGRDEARARQLANRLRPHLPDVTIAVYHDLETIVRSSDVVITTTASREPLIRGEWLRTGHHITAVGADDQTKCELDAGCLRRADRLIVDSIETNTHNGDIFRALGQGTLRLDQMHGEIGCVLSGELEGRSTDDEITIAKFVGLGVQDLAAAEVALARLGARSHHRPESEALFAAAAMVPPSECALSSASLDGTSAILPSPSRIPHSS